MENTDISEGRKGSLQFHLKQKAFGGVKNREQVKGLDIRCIKCLIDIEEGERERNTFYITHHTSPMHHVPLPPPLHDFPRSSDLLIF